jgi:predicted nucleic acid-binding protein
VPVLLFPDNTVLINFAYIRRMDLLAKLARNSAWCATVAWECGQSSKQPGLQDMTDAHNIFGEPLRPETPAEHTMTRTLRTQLAKPGDGPYKHLGEAETLAIMASRSLRGIFATDDRAVPVLARAQSITVITTWDLLRTAAHAGYIDRDALWSNLRTLREKGRGGPSRGTDRESYERWLDEGTAGR